eukprot:SAG11_NODE_929_length_6503_cov_9.709557_5_plen_61_part_00
MGLYEVVIAYFVTLGANTYVYPNLAKLVHRTGYWYTVSAYVLIDLVQKKCNGRWRRSLHV